MTFQIYYKAKAKGYVALGFSPNGGMAGSDIFMAWIDGNNQVVAQVCKSGKNYWNDSPFLYFANWYVVALTN